MKRRVRQSIDIERDPFGELPARTLRWRAQVLGAGFEFTSNSRELLAIVRQAFERVPQHRWPRGARRVLRIHLKRVRDTAAMRARPPKPVLSSGAGLLSAHVDAQNFVLIDVRAERALIQVSDSMLRHRQLLRYELIEFAAITLATRSQELVALHAGCVGSRGRGLLLLGPSGAGKSTLALHAALGGLDFLAEDSVFVQSRTLHATGLSAHVHARKDALSLVAERPLRRAIQRAPLIQRRSGVRKHELNLRATSARLAERPLRIVATVVLSAQGAAAGKVLVPMSTAELRRTLRAEQGYAMGRPGWREFERRALRAGGFRLARVPPDDGVSWLRALLAPAGYRA